MSFRFFEKVKELLMRRIGNFLILLSLFAATFAFVSPSLAQADGKTCFHFEVPLVNEDSSPHTAYVYFSNAITHEVLSRTATLTLNPGEHGTLSLTANVPSGIPIDDSGSPNGLSFNFGDLIFGSCSFGRIGDGRINDGPDQEGAPLAAYCTADKGIAVWDIDDSGHGTLAFTVTQSQISTALSKATSSGQNVLIGQGLGDSLYALSSNQLTLVGPDIKEPGKMYEFITTPNVCG